MTMTWKSTDLMQLCIRKDYYTHGDCFDYERMLAFVRENDPTEENIRKVAIDVVMHSGKNFYNDGVVEAIVEELLANVVRCR